MNRTQSELCAAGALSKVLGEEGVSIADALARLSDEEYRTAIAAIELYRKAHRPLHDAPIRIETSTIDDEQALLRALRVEYPHAGFENFMKEQLVTRPDLHEEARAAFYTNYPRPADRKASFEDYRIAQKISSSFRHTLFPR